MSVCPHQNTKNIEKLKCNKMRTKIEKGQNEEYQNIREKATKTEHTK
jgi:hypothetical protein